MYIYVDKGLELGSYQESPVACTSELTSPKTFQGPRLPSFVWLTHCAA